MFNLSISIDGFVDNVSLSRCFASSGGAEESAGRNRCCHRTRAFPKLRGSSKITIRRCSMQGGIEMETCCPSSCVVLLVLEVRYPHIYSYICHTTDVPHAATEDRVYNGLFIPKGARDITTRVLKKYSDHHLTRCLVDWKYLVRRVHDCLCGDFSFFAGRSHATRMYIQSLRPLSPRDFSILMGHCGTTMLR